MTVTRQAPPAIVTIGNFDGVHLGHQSILRQARRLADHGQGQGQRHGQLHGQGRDRAKGRVVVLCFDPHPASTLRPGTEPPRLTTTPRRRQKLLHAGADEVHLLRPTREFLSQTPDQFIKQMVETWHPSAIVEGEDFRFGKARAGDMEMLRRRGQTHGFEVTSPPPCKVRLDAGDVVRVGSSLIRWLIGRGRMMDAARCLGRPFDLAAQVVRGQQQGRQIGVPTVNLDPNALNDFIIPADGVYAGYAQLISPTDDRWVGNGTSEQAPENGQTFLAAISVGEKPTFGQSKLTVEAHLLDLDLPGGDELYGKTVRFTFARWLRDQYAYPDLDSLKAQLHSDIELTRRLAASGLQTHLQD